MPLLKIVVVVFFWASGMVLSTAADSSDKPSEGTSSSGEPTGEEASGALDGIPEGATETTLDEPKTIRYQKDGKIHPDQISSYFTDAANKFVYAQLNDGTVIRSSIQEDGNPCFACFEVWNASETDEPRAPATDEPSSGHHSGGESVGNGEPGAGNGGDCPPGGS